MELFPIERKYPPGFSYLPEFLTMKEEEFLLQTIARLELHAFNFHGYVAMRRVASFGYDYSFTNRSLTKGLDIPDEFQALIGRVGSELQIPREKIAELLVTEYPVGAVINWHRDAPPFDVIAGISLRSDCAFRLRPHDKAKQGRGSIVSIPVDRRSLYVISGEARTAWEHSTAPVKEVRYSVTLRTLR